MNYTIHNWKLNDSNENSDHQKKQKRNKTLDAGRSKGLKLIKVLATKKLLCNFPGRDFNWDLFVLNCVFCFLVVCVVLSQGERHYKYRFCLSLEESAKANNAIEKCNRRLIKRESSI